MFKVPMQVLELALKNQEYHAISLQLDIAFHKGSNSKLVKSQLKKTQKSIEELKFYLGIEE